MAGLRVPLKGLSQGELILPREAAHYVTRVHRLRAGDEFSLFDPWRGLEASAEVIASTRAGTRCSVSAPQASTAAPAWPLTLIWCVAKGAKPERVVHDATCLGVQDLVLVRGRRSVATVTGESRLERLEAVAVEAARQCGRGDLPRVVGPVDFSTAVSGDLVGPPSRGLKLLLVPDAADSLQSRVAACQLNEGICLLIGPEGGLSDDESDLARAADFAAVRFAPFVLRTETAVSAALGALVSAFDHGDATR